MKTFVTLILTVLVGAQALASSPTAQSSKKKHHAHHSAKRKASARKKHPQQVLTEHSRIKGDAPTTSPARSVATAGHPQTGASYVRKYFQKTAYQSTDK